jgi:hypothetical protein
MYTETNERGINTMAKKESRHYAATITHVTYDDSEWQEVFTRVSLKRLEEICAMMLEHDDDFDTVIRAEIHERTYTKEEAEQLKLFYLLNPSLTK